MLMEQDTISIGRATFRLSGGALRQDADESPGNRPAMTSAHDVVAADWAAAEAGDWDAFGALLSDDVIYRGPQTREQVRGRDPASGSTWRASPTTGTSPCSGSSAKASTQRAGSSSPGQKAPSPAWLLRSRRRRQDRPDHRLLARAIRTPSQPRPSGRTLPNFEQALRPAGLPRAELARFALLSWAARAVSRGQRLAPP